MRGTHEWRLRNEQGNGIIPAHAGNTRGLRSLVSSARDHPRACGEHTGTRRRLLVGSGSSPRMRGTLIEPEYLASLDGIIPAHAGNTYDVRPIRRRLRDHPRACGEHAAMCVDIAACGGSSPRMRGTLRMFRRFDARIGIIPAHAGNTAWRCRSSTAARDHPRACGEHASHCQRSPRK